MLLPCCPSSIAGQLVESSVLNEHVCRTVTAACYDKLQCLDPSVALGASS